jgi:phasin family protein
MQRAKTRLTSLTNPLEWSLLQRSILALPASPSPCAANQENFMYAIPEQLSAASKANLDAQLSMMTALANTAFEGIEKVVELNLSAARATLEESAATTQQLLGAKDPQEFFSLTASKAQPTAEKALAYSRHLASIATNTQAELTKVAETQIAETSRKVIAFVDDLSKNAPAGTEHAIALVKSAIGNANAGYEQLAKTTKQAVDTLENTLSTAATQYAAAAEKTTAHAASRAKKQ